jgi:hypothetical protein
MAAMIMALHLDAARHLLIKILLMRGLVEEVDVTAND